MARANVATTDRGMKFGANAVGGWGVAALFAVMACGGAALSGCAGLATPSNATPTPQEVVQISPSDITFSNVAAGHKATQTAVLTNTGAETVTITQVALSSTQFAATGIATPMTIGPGQSAKFQVEYTGSPSGTVSGILSAMTARGGSSTKVKLKGSGSQAPSQLALSTTALNFGNVLVNGSSTQALTLTNSGQTAVQITQVGVTGGGFSASGLVAPISVPSGQSVALQAKFAPAIPGTATGAITVTSDALNPTSTVSLSGTAVAATSTMSVSPASLNFGNVNAGSSATQNVQVSNTGNTSLTLTQVSATGSGISVGGITTPLAIAPSQTVTMAVTFAPTTAGTTTGSLTLTNSNGVNAVAAVTGTGVQAGLSVTPVSASFGSVVTGNTNSQTIQMKNSGTANLTISQATATGAGFSLNGLALPLTLAPGQSGNFNVQYAPQSAGNVTGSVTIISNAPNSPTGVALTGTGVAASYTIRVNPSSLSFGSVNNGSSTSQGFTVTNTGNSNVAISGVTATGTGFAILSGSGAVTLSPNQSTSVSVQFSPTTAGSTSGSATVLSNATGSNSSVSLTGTGVAPTAPHSVALNWGASATSVAGYNVYRSTTSGTSYAKMNASPIGGVSYSDSSVQSGLTYYYVATSVDASGIESVYSNEVAAIVP